VGEEETVQKELDGAKRTKGIYQMIAMHMEDLGYKHTWLQCRTKMKTLVLNYKKVKDKNNITGNNRRKYPFYDAIDRIIGTRPASQTDVLISSDIIREKTSTGQPTATTTSKKQTKVDNDDLTYVSESDNDDNTFGKITLYI